MRRVGWLVVGLALVATGCGVFSGRPALDVTGRWEGMWYGHGILNIPRAEEASADLTQDGGTGYGRITLLDTNAAEGVPKAMRFAGAVGSRVRFSISGTDLVMKHERGGEIFTIDFDIEGDRLVGRVRETDTPVRIVLARAKPTPPAPKVEAAAPPPSPEPTPPPPPPPPVAAAPPPEPERTLPPPPVAAAPPPEPEPTPAPAPAPEPTPPPMVTARPAPEEFEPVEELKPIFFAFDKAEVRPEDTKTLDDNVLWLSDNPETLVLIEGHADERGTNEYNLALGERRAKAARDYLVAQGVDAERIMTISYGEERPVCTERAEACWAQNRRAAFLAKPR